MKTHFVKLVAAIFLISVASLPSRGAEAAGNSTDASQPAKRSPASSTHVRGYTKKTGTYIPAHQRTKANKTKADNYSTKGNVNPYTGKVGTKNPEEN